MKVNDIRKKFLSYFEKNNHVITPSSPVVPHNDPTLLFTNAGMVPFKSFFTGEQKPQHTNVTSAQKCIRAGGKHNDLDNVGYTARHHTFFEMMGNFSFGGYFKEEAIYHAWTLLTKDFSIPPEKLLFTVYHTDEQSRNIWKKVSGCSDDRIISINTKDNFWSMGDFGPCGPCSEIFYDHGDHIPGGPPGSPEEDGDRFIEIWNLVFMQQEKRQDGTFDLPKPCIDTGLGLERFAAILQKKENNFEIDLFINILEQSAKITGKPLSGSSLFSHRIVVDHLRSSSFLIADGILPSNEGRGYVLRRIMRRAMLHAHFLGAKDPLMHQLFPSLQKEMGGHFKELFTQETLILETLKAEEERFLSTLDKGLHLLHSEMQKMGSQQVLNGDVAFTLYDTYGFPLDLTEDILKKENKKVDHASFEKAMQEQKERGKASWKGNKQNTNKETLSHILNEKGETTFKGYEGCQCSGDVIALIQDDQLLEKAQQGDTLLLVTDQTCFYPEQGGQVGDQGKILAPHGVISIKDTQKHHGLIVHHAFVEEGHISLGENVQLHVNQEKRASAAANHTATHLLNAALRHIVGDHVIQKGSYVSADGLRFDFSSNKPIPSDTLVQIEDMINHIIQKRVSVATTLKSYTQAVEDGALSLPGAAYDQDVRVVAIEEEIQNKKELYSMELCGGTHVKNTQDILAFKITSEGSVASGVRRIEAITGAQAIQSLYKQSRIMDQIKKDTSQKEEALQEFVVKNIEQVKTLKRENLTLINKLIRIKHPDYVSYQEQIISHQDSGDVTLYIYALKEGIDDIKSLLDSILKKSKEKSIILITRNNGEKCQASIGVTKDIAQNLPASNLLKAFLTPLNGKGGGKAELAMGSGDNTSSGYQQGTKALEDFIKTS